MFLTMEHLEETVPQLFSGDLVAYKNLRREAAREMNEVLGTNASYWEFRCLLLGKHPVKDLEPSASTQG